MTPSSYSIRQTAKSGAHRFATALVGRARAEFHRLGLTATIACAYGAIALVTFGHAASETYAVYAPEYERCKADPKCVPWSVPQEPATYVGLMAGAAWPLYWSWELQQ